MTAGNPLLNKTAGLEGLHWGILGEYIYSVVIVVHVACFLPQKKKTETPPMLPIVPGSAGNLQPPEGAVVVIDFTGSWRQGGESSDKSWDSHPAAKILTDLK